MYSFLDVLKRPLAGWLAALIVGLLASLGVSDDPELSGKIADFAELFVTIFAVAVGDIFKRYLQNRTRKSYGVVPELLESNHVSSLTHVGRQL